MFLFSENLTKRQLMTSRNLLWAVGGLAVFGAAAMLLPVVSQASEGQEQERARPLPVETLAVRELTSVRYQRHYTGEIVARRRSKLSFERAGLIADVLVDDGERVERGQVLARLDTAALETEKDELLAQQAAEEARLAEMVAGPRKEAIAVAQAQVEERAALAEFWQREHQRQSELYERGATGKKEYLDAMAQDECRPGGPARRSGNTERAVGRDASRATRRSASGGRTSEGLSRTDRCAIGQEQVGRVI
jgi:multidrug efflux pump subunit AcrA (membrane-fusion protein)